MINYSRLRHVVILAQPQPKMIDLTGTYSNRSNCRKALKRQAKRDGRDRSEFTIVKTTSGRFRYELASASTPSQTLSGA